MLQNALLQLCIAAVALAAPIANNDMHVLSNPGGGVGGGIVGFIVLVLDILVWIELFKSKRPPSHKILWGLLVFFFPIVGVILYWLLSDRKKWNDQGYEVLP